MGALINFCSSPSSSSTPHHQLLLRQLISLTTIAFAPANRDLCHFGVGDVLVGGEEQHHLPLLVLDRHNVQQTPERGTCTGWAACGVGGKEGEFDNK